MTGCREDEQMFADPANEWEFPPRLYCQQESVDTFKSILT
jgi:hypothetical protein